VAELGSLVRAMAMVPRRLVKPLLDSSAMAARVGVFGLGPADPAV
jgi:hypothetical protein